ncbi:MAG TPA: gephyrin-like molybdotransferase Glp [Candidatus Dormibacteraeota bacterium]|nr:gephyrin-like molybdotransferase Glp [Candidatus Dormibacteraeota bacterium]
MRVSTYPLIDADEAAATVLHHMPVLGVERVELAGCFGRVLAEDLVAEAPLPPFPSSAVDGYAVRASDAGRTLRVLGESAAGRPFDGTVLSGTAARVLTGGVVPDGADAVVMVEEVQLAGEMVTVPTGLKAGTNFHKVGDDLKPGDRILTAGTHLGAAEIGIAAATGRAQLPVRRRPRVALMSTGDELVEVGKMPRPGQIPDSNRWALLAALRDAGAEVQLLGIAPDEPEPLRRLVIEALRSADVLVTSGGVSVGTHDLVKPLLESLGNVHVGRVKLKPGKPFTFATLSGGQVAFGLPGFPVSSLVTFEVFVRPALRKMQGHADLHRPMLPVRLAYDARPTPDRTEYQRVTLRREGRELVAETTGSQSSSRLMSLAGAHALVRVPAGGEGISKGSIVEALILSLP